MKITRTWAARIGLLAFVMSTTTVAAPYDRMVNAAEALSIGGAMTTVVPARVLDSRPGESTVDGQFQGDGARSAGSTTELQIVGRGGVVSEATAVALNVTITAPDAAGFVTVWPCGQPRPLASSVNYAPGQTVANAVISKVGTDGKVCLYTLASTHLIVDVNGAFALGSAFEPLVPARVLETRPGESTVDGQFQAEGARAAGSTTELQIAGRGGVVSEATAVAVNVTITAPDAAGFVTVWPCGQPRPLASSVNYAPGQTVANAVISKVGTDGKVCLYTLASTHLIVDVNGAVNHDWVMDVTLAVGTVILDGDEIVSVAATSDAGGTITFTSTTQLPPVGGQLVVVPNSKAPEGIVGEVTGNAGQADGNHVVTLSPTSLDNVFTEMDYHYEGPLSSASGSRAVGDRFVQLFGAAECSTDGGVDIAPSLNVNFTGGEFDIDFGPFNSHALVRLDGNVEAGLAVTLGAEFTCSLTLPAVTFVIPFATIDLVPVLSVTISGEVSIGATVQIPFSVGLEAGPTGVRNLSTVDPGGSGSIESDLAVQVTLRAAIEPQLKFLGLAGGTLNLGVNLTGAVTPFSVPCARIAADASIEFGIELGRWGVEWDATLATVNFPEIELWEKRDGCPAADTAWVGAVSFSMNMDRQTISWPNSSDTFEHDYSWTASSSVTDLLGGSFATTPDAQTPADARLDWSGVQFFSQYQSTGILWQCTHSGGGYPGNYRGRMYDTDFNVVDRAPANSTVYLSLLAYYEGAPQTFAGDPIAACESTASGPHNITQHGVTIPPESFGCLPGTIQSGGECLVVAQVSADGRHIDVDLSMSGVATTATLPDAGEGIKHRVHNVNQQLSVRLTLIDV